MGLTVGIDLGTSNSCIAVVENGRPRIIEDDRGYNILPSCIGTKGRGRFVVGHGAKALVVERPTETLYGTKRMIGRKYEAPEVQVAAKNVSYGVTSGSQGEVLLQMGEVEISPEEAASIILKAVKGMAEEKLGQTVTDAVITVPANFSHSQRQATMRAGEMAGLNVLRLLNEPTAAALAFGFKKDLETKIAVFDLGGGTFDVSVIEVGQGVYEILSTAGDTFLGGEDFDYRIVNWMADAFQDETGSDPREDPTSLQRMKDAAERAKCELSFVDKTPILIPHLVGDKNLELEFTRPQLEELVQDLINKAIKITDDALRSAALSVEDLDEIILVGGMTRMPKIQESIKVYFGKNPCKGVHPEEVVAVGAAVHSFNLDDEEEASLLLDVTPFSLGMDVAGGFFKHIIERNTTVPCSETRTFKTVRDNQSEVKVVVRQGEEERAGENEFLGEFVLHGIRPAPAMTPHIDVTFRIDSNGILHVNAADRDTQEEQAIEIRDYIDKVSVAAEEMKAVALSQAEAGDNGTGAAGSAGEGGDGAASLLGKLANKLAGAAKSDEKGEDEAADPYAVAPRSQDEHAIAPRTHSTPAGEQGDAAGEGGFTGLVEDPETAEDALSAVAAALGKALDESGVDAGVAESTSPPPLADPTDAIHSILADPFAITERSPNAPSVTKGAKSGAPEASLDPFGIAPRDPSAAAAASPTAGSNSDGPELDPFGIAPRKPGSDAAPAIEHSSPLAAPKAAPDPKQKRAAKLRITYKSSAKFVREYQRNLTRGGTFIKTPDPLEVGRRCLLHLTVPDWPEPIEVEGSVVWSSASAGLMEGQAEGMGIKYSPEDQPGLIRLREALETLGGKGSETG